MISQRGELAVDIVVLEQDLLDQQGVLQVKPHKGVAQAVADQLLYPFQSVSQGVAAVVAPLLQL